MRPGTYRVVLIREGATRADDTEVWHRDGIPGETVEEIAGVLREAMPMVLAARGAHQAMAGIRQTLEGLAGMQQQRKASRGRR